MNYELTDEQTMLLDSLRAFVEEEILPHEELADEAAEVPPEIGERIKDRAIEMGFFAANLPESAGGGGLDYSTLGLIERELGKVSYALGAFIGRPTELLLACEGEQIEKYLATCVSGEKHECFALTEPGAGSDIMALTTKAVADGDDYIINGSKHFISTPVLPDFAIVFAITGVDASPRGERKRLSAFLVDRGHKGFDLQLGPICTSQRAYRTYELRFDDCRVHKSQMLGEEGKGLDLANKWLHMGRVWVAAQSCGKMERLLDLASDWAVTRKQFGKSIGKFQGTSFKIADIATDLHASDLMLMYACNRADKGLMTSDDAATVERQRERRESGTLECRTRNPAALFQFQAQPRHLHRRWSAHAPESRRRCDCADQRDRRKAHRDTAQIQHGSGWRLSDRRESGEPIV